MYIILKDFKVTFAILIGAILFLPLASVSMRLKECSESTRNALQHYYAASEDGLSDQTRQQLAQFLTFAQNPETSIKDRFAYAEAVCGEHGTHEQTESGCLVLLEIAEHPNTPINLRFRTMEHLICQIRTFTEGNEEERRSCAVLLEVAQNLRVHKKVRETALELVHCTGAEAQKQEVLEICRKNPHLRPSLEL